MAVSHSPLDLRDQLQRHLGATFRVDQELGGGGSARVFLAMEIALERPVVLKVLPPEVSRGVDAERFRREILFAAKLQHPHLVPLLNAGTVTLDSGGELRWFSMPFVEGHSLREILRRELLAPGDVPRLLRELASALAYAHSRGIVHRDIKPENVLMSEGVSMIADFGVAKALDTASSHSGSGKGVTTTSTMLGTPAYMAPEQVLSATIVDHTADIYAFGCVAYELLTGQPPLVRDSLRATLAAQVSDAPTPIRQLRPDLSPALADIIMRCLEKDPPRRPASATMIVRVLDELSQSVHNSGAFTAVSAPAATAPSGPPRVATATTPTPAATPAPRAPADTPVHSPARSGATVLLAAVAGTAVVATAVWFFLQR
jgi:serine/threonine-protein kinase